MDTVEEVKYQKHHEETLEYLRALNPVQKLNVIKNCGLQIKFYENVTLNCPDEQYIQSLDQTLEENIEEIV